MADTPAGSAPYPRELERTVRLANGAVVRLRPIRPDDAPRLVALYGRLSQHTAYQRFFTVLKRLPPDWAQRPRRRWTSGVGLPSSLVAGEPGRSPR